MKIKYGMNLKEAPENKRVVLDFKKAGFTRDPERDFSDDGTRFYGYMHKSGMPMTYASFDGNAYISLNPATLKGLAYSEYSKLPSYKLGDMYNGVPKEEVNMNELDKVAEKLMKEYQDALDNVENISDEVWNAFIKQEKNQAIEKYNKMSKLVKSNFDAIIDKYNDKNFGYSIKRVFDYLNNVKSEISQVDRMISASETRKRDIINQNGHIVRPEEDDFYCKEIQEIISKIK